MNDDALAATRIERRGAAAYVTMMWPDGSLDAYFAFRDEFTQVLRALREDDGVRVVVLTGAGGRFLSTLFPGRPSPAQRDQGGLLSKPENAYRAIRETADLLDLVVSTEKPIVAMVNGDAVGLGASLAMLCDLIVADEDARFSDAHTNIAQFVPDLPADLGVTPGDGGASVWPLQISLAKAKEILFLSRVVTGRDLAEMHAINAAVPGTELRATVDALVDELLARPAWALAWAKVVVNKRLRQNLNLTQDLAIALEILSLRAFQSRDELRGKGVAAL